MKTNACLLCVFALVATSTAADFGIQSLGRNGQLSWTNAFPAGVVTVETKGTADAPWMTRENYFTSNTVGSARVTVMPGNGFIRLLTVDISTNSPRHYTNLLESYGILETVAGKGDSNSDESHWLPSYEGEWATNVNLSRPHISFGDPHGNVLIVDQRSDAVLKVTPEGRLYTFAGTHEEGDNGDGPALATTLQLNDPNGGWMRADGTLYILDTENGKVRKLDTNGVMTTLFSTAPMGDGRALWVKSDESVVYFGSGDTATNLNKWTPSGGVTIVRKDFQELGNIMGDERTGDIYVSDRLANRVYRMDANGALTTIAGNGTQGLAVEGALAVQTPLALPRCVWFLPNGGFFLSEHDVGGGTGLGNRIWYVDPAGIIHRWMNGSSAKSVRVGDGQWFYANPNLAKVSRVRAVNTDPFGNIIITESNYGFVRRIRFNRLTP